MTYIDVLGKLLAMENITIIRSNNSTASFDTENRVLTIPLWQNMTSEIEAMLVSHEVAHALFTKHALWVEAIGKGITPKSYYNIIEDARIERLMKVKYPGIKKTFYQGYKQLFDQDFFQLQNINLIKLIDKINIYFKFGLFTPELKFTDEEFVLVKKVEAVSSMNDMILLAEEIYQYDNGGQDPPGLKASSEGFNEITVSNDAADNSSLEQTNQFNDSSNEEDIDDSAEQKESTKSSKNKKSVDDAITDKVFNDKLASCVDTKTHFLRFTLDDYIRDDVILSYKNILNYAQETALFSKKPREIKEDFIPKFKEDNRRTTSYLAKEFEMRKAARGYRRAKITKSGSIDTNRIFSYKVSDDIFRQLTVIPNEKSHGMIFLLDWSSSMDNCIVETIHQTINLVSFCRRVNIPFEVLAFTSLMKINTDYQSYQTYQTKPGTIHGNHNSGFGFSLLQLFSSKMTNHEFNEMINLMINHPDRLQTEGKIWKSCNKFKLGSTPLNEALLYMLKFIPKFKQTHNIEKTSLVVLSDGASDSLEYTLNDGTNAYTYTYDVRDKKHTKITLLDEVTKKEYNLGNYNDRLQTIYLYDILKTRLKDITIIGFYLLSVKQFLIEKSVLDNFSRTPSTVEINKIRSKLNETGVYQFEKPDARDIVFFVKQIKDIEDNEAIDIVSTDSAYSIAKKFTKNVNKMKTSKVLLDKFISVIS